MATQRHTSISSTLTRWVRLREVSIAARWLWIALYTSREAKSCVPGLFFGSVYTAADAAGMTPQDADKHMQELVDARLILWDRRNELVRLIELPDSLDRAHTQQAIYGWWTNFRNVPACALRDSHVPQLQALVMDGKVNDKMREAWKCTFGTISVPASIPFLPSSASSDTSTKSQPSLFAERPSASLPSENQSSMKSGTVVLGPRTGSGSGISSSSPEQEPSNGPIVENAHGGVVVGPWGGSARHLRSVPIAEPPARPTDTLPDLEAEARNARADEMKALWQQTAAGLGADFLIDRKLAKET